jgi:hypothetical protein
MESLARRKAWLKEASSLQRRFNFAWWYQKLSIPLALLGCKRRANSGTVAGVNPVRFWFF